PVSDRGAAARSVSCVDDIAAAEGAAAGAADAVVAAVGVGVDIAGGVGVAMLNALGALCRGGVPLFPGGGVVHLGSGAIRGRLGGGGEGEIEGKRERDLFQAVGNDGVVHDVLRVVGRDPVAPLPVVAGFNAGPPNHENAAWELPPGPRDVSAR